MTLLLLKSSLIRLPILVGLLLIWTDEEPAFISLLLKEAIPVSFPNLAISENGLLPYQLCGSNESNLGAGVSFSSFIHNGVEQLIAVTASSSWGEGARLPRVEFLAFFRPNDPKMWNCPGIVGHCEFLPRGAPIITPNVTCRVLRTGTKSRPGYFSILAAESLKKLFVGGLFSVVNIMCPSLELDLPSFGKTTIELYIGDEGLMTLSLNICYMHVTSIRRASLCNRAFGRYQQ